MSMAPPHEHKLFFFLKKKKRLPHFYRAVIMSSVVQLVVVIRQFWMRDRLSTVHASDDARHSSDHRAFHCKRGSGRLYHPGGRMLQHETALLHIISIDLTWSFPMHSGLHCVHQARLPVSKEREIPTQPQHDGTGTSFSRNLAVLHHSGCYY